MTTEGEENMNWRNVGGIATRGGFATRGGIATRGFGGLLATLSMTVAVAQAPSIQYSVLERISGPGGGWDYAMIDAASQQLHLGRAEGVLTMNLDTKKITPVPVAGEGVHAAPTVPGTQ